MIKLIPLILFSLLFYGCNSQNTPQDTPQVKEVKVGGPCEGCEAVLEYGKKELSSIDTLPGFEENTPKIKISGTVFHKDGKTPAPDVIIYIYHTNREGIYEKKETSAGWEQRHGIYRGWVKTGPDGKYTFYTFRPASYPGRAEPEHIHYTIKEPDKNEYYIEDLLFDDDPLLTQERRSGLRNRAGSGIVNLQEADNMLIAKRDIILGLNIPDYP